MVVVGFTVMFAVLAPVFHKYVVFAILEVALKLTLLPAHDVVLDGVILIMGNGFTVKLCDRLSVHPLASVPITV